MPAYSGNGRYEKVTEKDSIRDSDEAEASLLPVNDSDARSTGRRPYRITIILAAVLASILALSIAQLVLISTRLDIISGPVNEAPCGTTVAQAKATKGCRYSYALGDWIHDECYDQELEDWFIKKVPFENAWYYPTAENKPDYSRPMMKVEELENREFGEVTWTTWRLHSWHCVATWRHLHKQVQEGKKVSAGVARISHTNHCGEMLVTGNWTLDEVMIAAVSGFPPCMDPKHYHKTHKLPYEAGEVK